MIYFPGGGNGFTEGAGYIKLGNTLICWGTIDINTYGDPEKSATWTYPLAFKTGTIPVVVGSINSSTSYWTRYNVAVGDLYPTQATISIRELNAGSHNNIYTVGCLAIGVWQ